MKEITIEDIKNLGFDVEKDEDCYSFRLETPRGENWEINLRSLEDFVYHAKVFDPNLEFIFVLDDLRDGYLGPIDIESLWKDQLWKKNLLKKLFD